MSVVQPFTYNSRLYGLPYFKPGEVDTVINFADLWYYISDANCGVAVETVCLLVNLFDLCLSLIGAILQVPSTNW